MASLGFGAAVGAAVGAAGGAVRAMVAGGEGTAVASAAGGGDSGAGENWGERVGGGASAAEQGGTGGEGAVARDMWMKFGEEFKMLPRQGMDSSMRNPCWRVQAGSAAGSAGTEGGAGPEVHCLPYFFIIGATRMLSVPHCSFLHSPSYFLLHLLSPSPPCAPAGTQDLYRKLTSSIIPGIFPAAIPNPQCSFLSSCEMAPCSFFFFECFHQQLKSQSSVSSSLLCFPASHPLPSCHTTTTILISPQPLPSLPSSRPPQLQPSHEPMTATARETHTPTHHISLLASTPPLPIPSPRFPPHLLPSPASIPPLPHPHPPLCRWDRNGARDFAWYVSLFDEAAQHMVNTGGSAVTGEASSTLLTSSGVVLRGHVDDRHTVPQLLHLGLPRSKFIVILRNPVDRFFSEFNLAAAVNPSPSVPRDFHKYRVGG
ncbi:unnamed protein product [Closterium sp. Naga37s-1]|nr:unnamed protein product [Closterium sp. Naga37s-1]